MCAENKQSLVVAYGDLNGMMGFWVADYPEHVRPRPAPPRSTARDNVRPL